MRFLHFVLFRHFDLAVKSHLKNQSGTTDHSLSHWTSLKIIWDHVDKVRGQHVNGTLKGSATDGDGLNGD